MRVHAHTHCMHTYITQGHMHVCAHTHCTHTTHVHTHILYTYMHTFSNTCMCIHTEKEREKENKYIFFKKSQEFYFLL